MYSRIKQIRKNHNLTQDEFAKRLNISISNIKSYETGRRTPSEAFINLICEKFHINKVWLLTGEGSMEADMSKVDEMVLLSKKILQDEDDTYRQELVKIIADMDTESIKRWYNYAKQWVDNVEKK